MNQSNENRPIQRLHALIDRGIAASKSPWVRKLYMGVVGLALVLLGWAVASSWQQLSEYDWQWQWPALIYSCIGYNGTLLTATLGWRSIMRRLGSNIPLRKHWKVYTFTNIAKRLPSGIWYASGRLLMYEQMGVAKRTVSLALILEMLLITYTGALLASLLVFFLTPPLTWSAQVWIYASFAVCIVLALKPQWLVRAFNYLQGKLGRAPLDIILTWRDLIRWIPFYILTWASGGLMLYWMICAFYSLPSTSVVEIVSIWTISGLIGTLSTTFLPLSIGPRELALTALLQTIIPLPVAAALAIFSRIWLAINQAIWFGISWFL
ncbi:MAG: flippase-like domain-containing protein [Anaerolineales bacterium]|nr:flippase-like domain-containing protein [Anaerolineales bacterium]